MALLFCDGVRHYSTDERIAEKWTSVSPSLVWRWATGGRNNGPSIRISPYAFSSFYLYITKLLPTSYGTLGCGFRFRQDAEMASGYRMLFAFVDSSSSQVALAIGDNGRIVAYRGGWSAVLGESSNLLVPDTEYYIEVKALFHTSTGTLEVRVNGTSTGWINLTGVNTQDTGNASANGIKFGQAYPINFQSFRYISDVVIWDTSGSNNNDFMGEVNVDVLLPSGAGTYSQLTPSSGSNYACVDETDPNTSDYVSGSVNGYKDTYAFTDWATGNVPTVKAVVNNLWIMKENSGTVYAKSVIRSGGTDYEGSNLTPETTYNCLQDIREVDPNTSAAWTKANINSAEFGVQVATS